MTGDWRPVLGWEGLYRVNSEGDVWSIRSHRLLKARAISSNGYRTLTLTYQGRYTSRTLHTVVAEAFLGLPPEGMEVRHKNGIKTDCRIDSLHYGTHQQNKWDQNEHGWNPARGTDNANGRKETCPYGHQLVEPNLRASVTATGKRGCRACHQAHSVVTYWAAKGVALDLRELADEKYQGLMRQ